MQKMFKTISGIVTLLILGALPVTSLASGTPAITTLAATGATSTTVTMNGFFSANGAPTSTWFSYGTSATNLSSNTNAVNQSSSSGQFSQQVTGLIPNTTYYFKAAGTNFYGTTYGSTILSFTTSAIQLPSLTMNTLAATNVGSSSATLNGHYNATITSPMAWFRYGTSSTNMTQVTSPQSMALGSNNYSANVSGLQPSTTYYFQAMGSQGGNQVSNALILSFTTTALPQASMTETTLGATSVGQTSATLNAMITMANTSATNRYFKWGTNSVTLNNTLNVSGTQNASGTFSATLSGLNPNTTYYFKAYAVMTGGTTVAASITNQFTTVAAPVTYACNDGIDNDGDGLVDFPADPGCTSTTDSSEYNVPPTIYLCSDGIDNDGDGLTDFPADPGCSSPTDMSEYNVPPVVYACNDGVDNDGDGLVDYPADPGCVSSTDQSEVNVVTTGYAPIATTNGANSITQTSANLNGGVNANGSTTNYWFEFGPNGAFNATTNQATFGTGNGPVNQTVTGLNAGTTYSYRLCASNAYGQNCGSTFTFTTSQQTGCTSNCGGCTYNCGCTNYCGGAPIVTTTSANNVTDTSAMVLGYVDPNGAGNAQVTFKYGSNGNLNYTAYAAQSIVTSGQQVTAFLTNLQPNTVYAFQICAVNQYGQNCGTTLSFVTTNSYINQNPYYPQQPPYYPTTPTNPQQPPIIIYTNTNSGGDYSIASDSLATLKINASKRDVTRDDMVSFNVTLTNESNRSLKNVKMNITAPSDLALTSTSLGDISFATNSVSIGFSSLAAGDSKTIMVTARVASDTTAKSFVVHADASYLNTLTGDRETVTAETVTTVGHNGLLASVFGAGVGGGIIWLLIIILVILLGVLAFGRNRRVEKVEAPLPPSRWPGSPTA